MECTLDDNSVDIPVWIGPITPGNGDTGVPIALELATFVTLGLMTGAGKHWFDKIAPFRIIGLEATTSLFLAAAVASASGERFKVLATFLPTVKLRIGLDYSYEATQRSKCIYFPSKGKKMQVCLPKKSIREVLQCKMANAAEWLIKVGTNTRTSEN